MGGVNLGDCYWAGSGRSLGLPTRAKLLNLTHINLFITAQLLYMTGIRMHPIIWAPAGTAPLTRVSLYTILTCFKMENQFKKCII